MKPCFLNFLLLLLIKKLLYPGGNGGALLPGLPTALNIIEHIYIYIYLYPYILYTNTRLLTKNRRNS